MVKIFYRKNLVFVINLLHIETGNKLFDIDINLDLNIFILFLIS